MQQALKQVTLQTALGLPILEENKRQAFCNYFLGVSYAEIRY
jgi:hypothetical protein